MQFVPPLQSAIFHRRYKRFLADIELSDGEFHTVHCPNTGAMTHCMVPQSPCWFSVSDNPKRKYPFTWEIATTIDGHLAGIHTGRANALVKEAIADGVIIELQEYSSIKGEVKYGLENSRIDFLLSDGARPDCYVEVKSVTLGMGKGVGLFPDAVSDRGAKHLRELMTMVDQGCRAVLVFCVQHTGITTVSPADDIDPVYGKMLRQAMAKGVEVLVYGVDISPRAITLTRPLDLLL
jgi:sugar fermentation stimulation protein A